MDPKQLIAVIERARDEDPELLRVIIRRVAGGDSEPPLLPDPAAGGAGSPGDAAEPPRSVEESLNAAVAFFDVGKRAEAAAALPGSLDTNEGKMELARQGTVCLGPAARERVMRYLETQLGLDAGELAGWLRDNNATIAGGAAVQAVFGDGGDITGDVDVWLNGAADEGVPLPPSWAMDREVTVWNRFTVYRHPAPGDAGRASYPPLQFIQSWKRSWVGFDYSYCRVNVGPDAVECTAAALVSNLAQVRRAHVGFGGRRITDVRSALRARKALRKGFTLSSEAMDDLVRFQTATEDRDALRRLEAAQDRWDKVFARDPTDLVAIAAAYEPLNHGKRRLVSVAIAEPADLLVPPVSLSEYKDT